MGLQNIDHASFLQRLIAWIIDNVLVFTFAMLLGAVFSVIIGMTTGWGEIAANTVTLVMTLISVTLWYFLQFLYFGFYWSKNGRSLGMTLMGIQVIRRDGRALSFLRSGLRGALGYTLSGLIFGLGYLWALFDPHGETFHDKLFDTWVLRAELDPGTEDKQLPLNDSDNRDISDSQITGFLQNQLAKASGDSQW